MSAIAGVVGNSKDCDLERDCRAMLAQLAQFGPHNQNSSSLGDACFGRALYRMVPEDRFDRQPLLVAGRYLLVLDCRIHNRDELAASLGVSPQRAATLSDSDIAAVAWERWQLAAFEQISGDVALAAWDTQAGALTLARSPMSLKSLFYCRRGGRLAFATMPQGLFALPWLTKRLDFNEAAATAAGFPNMGTATMFEGVEMVRHGHAVELSSAGERHRILWDPAAKALPMSLDDCAEALRSELDRSVRANMRRIGGPVACQLSSGRDSSAVAASAAIALGDRGEELIALTGAPSANFDGQARSNRLADESALAATTAAFYPNIVHLVCRSRPRPIGPELRQASQLHWRPITHLTAHYWTSEVDEQASRRGAKILLIGSAGNFSLSASGPRHLVDLLTEQGLGAWWRHVRAARPPLRLWPNLARMSFGPLFPEQAFRLMLKAAGRDHKAIVEVPVLRQPYRASAEALLREVYASARPPRSRRSFHRSMLLQRESADKMSLVLSGLDVRDPTADRRLAELALSIPADLLVSPHGAPSPVYERAFSGRLPRQILDNRRRGVQGADWFELLARDELRGLFRQLGANPIVSELLDLEFIGRLMDRWPTSARTAPSQIGNDQTQALAALAMADFLDVHFPA